MKATIDRTEPPKRYDPANKSRRLVAYYHVLRREGPQLHTVVRARIFHPLSRMGITVYADVHLLGRGWYGYGRGRAGGGGYHKSSAALAEALTDAGVTLSENISGRGETVMREALVAAARALGYRGALHLMGGGA